MGPSAICTVLCVDDHTEALAIRKLLLEEEGYAVLTADNGPVALSMLSSNEVHAVVLDYRMKPMDGVEVARNIRRNHGAWLPILLLTGYLGEISRELLPMFDACLTKGDPPETLLEELRRLLKRQPKQPPCEIPPGPEGDHLKKKAS